MSLRFGIRLATLLLAATLALSGSLRAGAASALDRPAPEHSPWHDLRAQIRALVLAVTDIGDQLPGDSTADAESEPSEEETDSGPKHDPSG